MGFCRVIVISAAVIGLAVAATAEPRVEISVEERRTALSEDQIRQLVALGKADQIDLATRERVIQRIIHSLPHWPVSPTGEELDLFGSPIVDRTPGLPPWSQRHVDGLRHQLSDILEDLDETSGPARRHLDRSLGNLLGQAVSRSIDVSDLVPWESSPALGPEVVDALADLLRLHENETWMRSKNREAWTPTRHPEAVVRLIEASGRSMTEVLAIQDPSKRDRRGGPSGCYDVEPSASGHVLPTDPTWIWEGDGGEVDDAEASINLLAWIYHYTCDDPTPNNSILVSTNGYLTFEDQGGGTLLGTEWNNATIPSTTDPDGFLAPSWDDYFVPGVALGEPGVNWDVLGGVGSSILMVTWNGLATVGHDILDVNDHTFQVLIWEEDTILDFRYSTDWEEATIDSATVGMESSSGTLGDCGPNCGNSNKWNGQPPNNYRFTPKRPANDDISGAQCLAPDVSPLDTDNFGATIDPDEGGSTPWKSVWYSFQAPVSGNVRFAALGEARTFTVFDDSIEIIGFATDTFPIDPGPALDVEVEGGREYLLRIKSEDGLEEAFQLSVTPQADGEIPAALAPQDECSTGAVLSGHSVIGTTVDNSGCADESSCGSGDLVDEWWTWVSPVTDQVTVKTENIDFNSFDTTLAVYAGCSSEIACDDDGGTAGLSEVSFSAIAGLTYSIRVAGAAGQTDPYRLRVCYPERCDGVDNDCDGAIDETFPNIGGTCGSTVGECQLGTLACSGGVEVCSGGVQSLGYEICDGLDNDCDGATDEFVFNEGASCGSSIGECSPGILACFSPDLLCNAQVGPSTEVCDGLDNDCNGVTDEGAGCPTTSWDPGVESSTISAAFSGEDLNGQNEFFLPSAGGETFEAYVYEGNALGFARNPAGQDQFVAGIGPGGSVRLRSERLFPFFEQPDRLHFCTDLSARFLGTLPAEQHIGSVSLRDGDATAVAALASWADVATAQKWVAHLEVFNSLGSYFRRSLTEFGEMDVDHWYRWCTEVDQASNEVLSSTLTDLSTGAETTATISGAYLVGGADPATLNAFRLYVGSPKSGNVLAFDNIFFGGGQPSPDYTIFRDDFEGNWNWTNEHPELGGP